MANARALNQDPYKNFRFKVYVEGDSTDNLIAGVNKVGGLSWEVDVVSVNEGGNCQSAVKLPGQISYESITLSRGMSKDKKFKDWAEAVWDYSRSNPLHDLRKTVIIKLCDINGSPVVKYTLERCWVSGFEALPELDAEDNALAIESITLEHEGWTHEVL